MQKPKANDAKVERSVPTGNVKSLKLSGIHNCCQPCCEAIKGVIATVDGVTGDGSSVGIRQFRLGSCGPAWSTKDAFREGV
jgi:hypothetical protein